MKYHHPVKNALLVLTFCAVVGLVLRLELSPSSKTGDVASRSPAARLEVNHRLLVESKSTVDAKTALQEMKKALRQMDAKEAVAWILQELEHSKDFATQLELELGTDQNLTAWPSYRVFLLDALMLVDPALAATKARELLQSPGTADEWAIAMRNLARGGGLPEDDALLKAKSAELLRNSTWRSQPSSGYLQAFDVIVHTKNTALAPELMSLCDKRDQQAVRHAAYLTLDRLLLVQPDVVLPALSQSASQHSQSGLMISNMIARADMREPKQQQAVETYLLDEQRTAEELQGFASVFPNANLSVSDNLLTKSPSIDGTELALKDRAALETITAWLADPKFARVQTVLRQSYQRLQGFVQQ